MKPYFLDMYAATRVYLPNLPSFGSLEVPVDNVSKDGSQEQTPALVSLDMHKSLHSRGSVPRKGTHVFANKGRRMKECEMLYL